MNHINRYGEAEVRPAKGPATVAIESEDEFGMHREESLSEPDWSHDPRSESAHERHHSGVGVEPAVSDETLQQRILQALAQGLGEAAEGIEVEVSEGVVTLKGTTTQRGRKSLAGKIVDELDCARDIFNQLSIADN